MTTTITSAIIGGIALIGLTGQARGEEGGFSAIGYGNYSCGRFLQVVDDERKVRPPLTAPGAYYTREYAAIQSYAAGFLTGANWAKLENVAPADDSFSGEMVWLENYCREHPLDHYIFALINLRNALAAGLKAKQ
jgi:hypothetical protein